MLSYQQLLRDVKANGKLRADRTGTGTRSVFARMWTHNMSDGFPLLTTKKMFFKGIVHELLWMISGSTNIKYLQDNNVKIWDAWAHPDTGEVGPIYGKQWRNFGGVDQLANLITDIRTNPDSRRMLVSAWNPQEVPEMGLPPCHYAYQVYVDRMDGTLSLLMHMRSADAFLGLPFDIASYALLLLILSHVTGYRAGQLSISLGDLHIYNDHVDQVNELLTRKSLDLPTVRLNPSVRYIDNIRYSDITLHAYESHPAILAPVAV